MTTNLNENPSSGKHQLNSIIQKTDKRTEKKARKPIEVEGSKEWEIKKILNKRKIQEIDRYLVQWKGFTTESNTWEREENLGNARELVNEFEGRLSAEVRKQEKVKQGERIKKNLKAEKYRRNKLLGKYIAKLLYGWDDRKFEKEYLRKLEKNWQRQKSVSLEEKP